MTWTILLLNAAYGASTVADLIAGDLVVTEIMTDPTTVAWYRGRWFEVYNASGGDVDLAGLVVSNGGSSSFTVGSSVTLAADDYAVFAFRSTSSLNGGIPAVDYVFSSSALALSPSGTLALSYGSTVIDTVTYDTLSLSGGAALALSSDATGSTSNDTASNWCEATDTYGSGDYGTPGAENDTCGYGVLEALTAGELVVSEVLIQPTTVAWYRGQWFEVTNTSDSAMDLDGLTISDDDGDSFTVSGTLVVRAGETAVFAMREKSTVNGGLPRVDYVFSSSDLALGEVDGLTLSYGTQIFDSVTWDSADYDAIDGVSLMLDGDTLDATENDDLSVWCAGSPTYGDGDYGTPGTVNAACDGDADGYAIYEDCDDSDASIYPGAKEDCDGADDDCDGTVDEGLRKNYAPDLDGDTYGDDDGVVSYCTGTAPSTWVTRVGDCDDTNSAVHTGATETCDGIDTNCSGDESDASDAIRYYPDVDNDFYGDSASSVKACSRPTKHRTNNLDCDDTDATINPKGTEACDGKDNDCDGDIDEDFSDEALAWYTDSDGDGFGDPDSEELACEQPEGTIATGDDCDDTDSSVFPGALDIFDGEALDCDDDPDRMSLSEAPLRLLGANVGDRLGYALDGAGDVNGDGYDDLLVSAYLLDDGAADAGGAYLLFGPLSYSADMLFVDEVADAVLTGVTKSDYAGFSVAGLGDTDGDGYADLLIGAFQEDTGGASAGAGYLVRGPVSGTLSLSAADAILTGSTAGDYAGRDVAAVGDLDEDGLPDLALGAYHEDTAGTGAGAVYLLSGLVSGALDLGSDASAILRGKSSYAYAGMSLDGAGDVNGDGSDDLLVGASLDSTAASYAGAAYLVCGPISGALSLSAADGAWTGAERDEAGFSVAGVGDVNDDGYADLLVGAPKNDTAAGDAGAAYLLLGPATASGSLSSTAAATFLGEGSLDWSAYTLSAAGDVNSDGYADLLIGVYRDDDAGTDAGAAWLVVGPASGSASLSATATRITGATAGAYAGSGIGAGGDLNADGADDLLIGAYGTSSGAGEAAVIWGLPAE